MSTILYLLGFVSFALGATIAVTSVIGLAVGISLIISGIFLLAFGRLLDAVEGMHTELKVISGQLRAQAGFQHSVHPRRIFDINGYPAKPMRLGTVSVETSIGELHFADKVEATGWMPPAPPAQDQRM